MKKEIGFIGLGKMGMALVDRLREQEWRVVVYDVDRNAVRAAAKKGAIKVDSPKDMVGQLAETRIIFLMVPAFTDATADRPAGNPVEEVLQELDPHLQKGDIVIDGGNSFYKDSVRRAQKLKKRGIYYLDTGISGGPVSIAIGRFAIMAGGEKQAYEASLPVFRAISDTESAHMGPSGAGHFAKMVHNGIEYGMMQALAEGFTVLKQSSFQFNLQDVARVYNQNSIITSRLVGWLEEGFQEYGEDLKEASSTVHHTGEGEWTVKTAKELNVPIPAIDQAFLFRVNSKNKPSYTGKILSTLRAVFGGHDIKDKP